MTRRTSIYLMTTCAIFAALMCICGPLSVPIGPVPVTLTNLVLYFAIFILGIKGTTVSYMIYLLLGIFGLPVFSGGQGGLGKIAGPTGGYLIGFILMIPIMGFIIDKTCCKIIPSFFGMVLGTLVAYSFGSVWFMFSRKMGLLPTLSACVFPFIPFDLIKMGLAVMVGREVRKALTKAALLPDFSASRLM